MATFRELTPDEVAADCARNFEGWHHSSVLSNGKTVAAIIDATRLQRNPRFAQAMRQWVCIDGDDAAGTAGNPYNHLLRALWGMNCTRLVGPARIRVRGSTPFCVTTVCDVERFIMAKPRLAGIANIASDIINAAHRKRAASVRYGGSRAYTGIPFPGGLTPGMPPPAGADATTMQQLAHIVKLTDDIELHGSKENTRAPRARNALAELRQARASAIAAFVHRLAM